MDIYAGAPGSIYQSLAEAMGWLLTWLKGKADGGALPSKGYERFEGVWAGHQVCLYAVRLAFKHHTEHASLTYLLSAGSTAFQDTLESHGMHLLHQTATAFV